MKKVIYLLIIFICLYSCEDIVTVELNESPPRLVIDAGIDWFKGTNGNQQFITLSLTAPFFNGIIQPANGATVFITDTNESIYNFVEDSNSGVYFNNDFNPVLEEEYELTIIYNNETYIASEVLKSVVPIDFIEQRDDGGFFGEDIELKAFYTDPGGIDNYYFFEFTSDIPRVPTLEVYEDRFTDGNQIFGFYTEEDLISGDQVTIRNHGVSQRFYNFMFTLLQQGSEESGGPFETQPATVRGNCINITNPDNFPFGYFRLSEVDEVIYIIQ